MPRGYDHLTLVVTDLGEATRFLAILGFREEMAVVASGETIASYMGIAGWESDHVTLVLQEVDFRQEIQLLRFHHPTPEIDAKSGFLAAPVSVMSASAPTISTRHWPTSPRSVCSPRTRSWTSTTAASSSSPARPASCSSWRNGRSHRHSHADRPELADELRLWPGASPLRPTWLSQSASRCPTESRWSAKRRCR